MAWPGGRPNAHHYLLEGGIEGELVPFESFELLVRALYRGIEFSEIHNHGIPSVCHFRLGEEAVYICLDRRQLIRLLELALGYE